MKNLIKSFLMLAVMLFTFSTAWAETVNVRYKDADGTTKYVDATVLNNTMNDLAAGWYVVNSFVDYNDDLYTNGDGDVNIILCDGATLTSKNITPKGDSDKIKIYGQRQGTGTADISGSITGNYSLTIYGGTINASELDGYQGGVTINGGTVNAGSISPYGSVYLYGGNVTVTGEINARDGNVVFGGGTVKAGSYTAKRYVCISKGLTYYDGTGASYTGTEEYYYGFLNLTVDEIAAIAGKTMRTNDYRSGTCGADDLTTTVDESENVAWLYDINAYTLTISGTGAMANFSSADDQPWKDSRTDIKRVTIGADITSISDYAFFGCSNLKTVYELNGDTPTSLGTNAFDGCHEDLAIYVPDAAVITYKEYDNWSAYANKIKGPFVSVSMPNKDPQYFMTLAEAVAYAGEMYDPEPPAVVPTVTLYDDINLGGSGFEFGDDENAIVATLDLNGHTISGDVEYLITVEEKSTLTVAGDGSIVDINYFGCLIENNGTLNITGGTYGNGSWITNNGTMTVSGGTFTAYGGFVSINNYDGSLTVSGGTFNVYDGGCAINNRSFNGTPVLTLSALPTFVHPEGAMKGTDIDLNENTVINFDKAITAAPTTPIVVKTENAAPYVFTSGYGTYVKDSDNEVADPGMLFVVNVENTLLGIHSTNTASEAALYVLETVTFPVGMTTYYSDKGLKLYDENENLKFYTVTNAVDDVAEVTEIKGKTFGKNTPLIVSNESNAAIDAVMVEAFDDADDADFAASCADDLGEKSVFSGFKGTAVVIDEIGFNNYKTYFGFTGHDFVKIRKDGPVAAHRCWIEMGGSSTFAKRLNLRWNEEEVTGVKGVNASLEVKDDSWYTIDGRKLNGHPTKQGVYINNGVKVFVK